MSLTLCPPSELICLVLPSLSLSSLVLLAWAFPLKLQILHTDRSSPSRWGLLSARSRLAFITLSAVPWKHKTVLMKFLQKLLSFMGFLFNFIFHLPPACTVGTQNFPEFSWLHEPSLYPSRVPRLPSQFPSALFSLRSPLRHPSVNLVLTLFVEPFLSGSSSCMWLYHSACYTAVEPFVPVPFSTGPWATCRSDPSLLLPYSSLWAQHLVSFL